LGRLSKRLVLALDADDAGLRSGLKSAYMALSAGFDVKVPIFPQGKDPADLARENPELLKAAVRTSKTAVEFFLEALRPAARDERAYKKAVEAQVLPLVAVIESRIEQEHFVRLVAGKLGVSDMAVRAEVERAAARGGQGGPAEADSPNIHQNSAESKLSPLSKKAGMLLFFFGRTSAVGERLQGIVGPDKLTQLEEELAPLAEELRFRFEAELGEHGDEVIAGDMLLDLEKMAEKERVKMKYS
jgi:DNA primase